MRRRMRWEARDHRWTGVPFGGRAAAGIRRGRQYPGPTAPGGCFGGPAGKQPGELLLKSPHSKADRCFACAGTFCLYGMFTECFFHPDMIRAALIVILCTIGSVTAECRKRLARHWACSRSSPPRLCGLRWLRLPAASAVRAFVRGMFLPQPTVLKDRRPAGCGRAGRRLPVGSRRTGSKWRAKGSISSNSFLKPCSFINTASRMRFHSSGRKSYASSCIFALLLCPLQAHFIKAGPISGTAAVRTWGLLFLF